MRRHRNRTTKRKCKEDIVAGSLFAITILGIAIAINYSGLSTTQTILAMEDTEISQYQDYAEEDEDDNTIEEDIITYNQEDIEEVCEHVDELVQETEIILDEQEKLLQKYESIPLSVDLMNEVLYQCDKWDVDPDIMLAIYSHESHFIANIDNSSSTARGLGQILKGTAKWAYSELYNDTYNHAYAYDPYLNIEMTTYYISYLHHKYNDANYYNTIMTYRGCTDVGYYNYIMSYKNKLNK